MNINILLVDDDIELCGIISDFLTQNDFEVRTANTLAEAEIKFNEKQPKIVLLDLKLPDGSGLEFLNYLENQNSQATVLMLSSHGFIPVAVEAIKSGAENFLTKPIDPDYLLMVLQKLVKQKQLQDRADELQKEVLNTKKNLIERNKELKNALKDIEEMQKQLILKEKMASLGTLVTSITHEINTPLGVINSNSDICLRSLERLTETMETSETISSQELPKARKIVGILNGNHQLIIQACKRLGEIVKNLQKLISEDDLSIQEYSINKGIENSLKMFSREFKENIRLSKNYGKIPKIKCHPNQINQVITNILRNALQSIDKEGIIDIKTFWDNYQNVYIRISDTGKGIPMERLTNIFDPALTSKGSRVRTGLGLSISYRIIQQHKGEINLESEVGKGTIVTIRLPVSPDIS